MSLRALLRNAKDIIGLDMENIMERGHGHGSRVTMTASCEKSRVSKSRE